MPSELFWLFENVKTPQKPAEATAATEAATGGAVAAPAGAEAAGAEAAGAESLVAALAAIPAPARAKN